MYNHTFYIYDKKYSNLDEFIMDQKKFDKILIKYPFDWYRIKLNTKYNIYNFHEYTCINHPYNQQYVNPVFNIDMKLIDVDGSKEKWYDKLITENNITTNK
jgi:hypothetical protein